MRSHLSGTWLGVMVAAWADGAIRLHARRLWSWEGALDGSVLAAHGPTGGRIGPLADVVLPVTAQVVEVIQSTSEALQSLAGIPPWTR